MYILADWQTKLLDSNDKGDVVLSCLVHLLSLVIRTKLIITFLIELIDVPYSDGDLLTCYKIW